MFMFATGIENSYPVVGGKRVDEMAKCGHYTHWQKDFDLVQELGIGFLRYGPPLHTTLLGRRNFRLCGRYAPVLQPLPPAGNAHRNQSLSGCVRRRGGRQLYIVTSSRRC